MTDSQRMVAVAICATLASCGHGPKRISASTHEGVRRAVAALRRANEYRDEGDVYYEPRYLEAQRAIDDIAVSRGIFARKADSYAYMEAHNCLVMLRTYRSAIELSALTAESLGSGRKSKDDLKQAENLRAGVGARSDRCVNELAGYLQ